MKELPAPLKVKRLYPDATIPAYQTDGAACFDTRAMNIGPVSRGETTSFRTGLAQAMLVPIPRVVMQEVDELSETERGAGGHGSTGR